MPGPVLATRKVAQSSFCFSSMETRPPSGVNFSALSSRFEITRCMRERSPIIQAGSSGAEQVKSIFRSSAMPEKRVWAVRTSAARSTAPPTKPASLFPAALLRHRLVRAEGRHCPAGSALPRCQGHPPRTDPTGLPLPECGQGACRKLRHQAHRFRRGRCCRHDGRQIGRQQLRPSEKCPAGRLFCTGVDRVRFSKDCQMVIL